MDDMEKCTTSQEVDATWTCYLGYFLLFLFLSKVLLSIIKGLYTCVLGPLLGHTVDFRKMGKWAVVTGATDGIGKAYAEQLAAKGLSIFLISRSPEKLQAVSDEIEKKYKVEVRSMSVDFTHGSEIYAHIERELNEIEIGVLVNNVGLSYDCSEYFTRVPNCAKRMQDIINCNIVSCTMMCRIALSQMEKRDRGVVINISSLSAVYPSPLLATYGATKVYVDHFSRALNYEYKQKGIIVQCVMPSFVATKMAKIRKPTLTVPTPETYVRWALSTVGLEHRTAGYPPHKLQLYAQEVLGHYYPESVSLGLVMNNLKDLRRRYYKKHGLVDDFLSSKESKKSS